MGAGHGRLDRITTVWVSREANGKWFIGISHQWCSHSREALLLALASDFSNYSQASEEKQTG